jgi:hypothetical protein
MKLLKRTILASGAVLRILIGIGAATMVCAGLVGLKKGKERKRKR